MTKAHSFNKSDVMAFPLVRLTSDINQLSRPLTLCRLSGQCSNCHVLLKGQTIVVA